MRLLVRPNKHKQIPCHGTSTTIHPGLAFLTVGLVTSLQNSGTQQILNLSIVSSARHSCLMTLAHSRSFQSTLATLEQVRYNIKLLRPFAK